MAEGIVRTFFGFDLPPEIPGVATRLRTLVNDPKRAVRWVKGTNIHLTIRFLGPTPNQTVYEIEEALHTKLVDSPSLTVRVEGTGVFPTPTRPRVIWLGLKGDIDGLRRLEEEIYQVVEPMGFPREEREFKPHITIGRVRYPQKITPDVTKFMNAQYEPVNCMLQELHLYESRMGNKGVTYIPLATFPLKPIRQETS